MIYDVMVVGAGLAGSTAAVLAAAAGQRVVLLERLGRELMPQRGHDWVTCLARPLLEELGVGKGGGIGQPFEGAAFHGADLTRSVQSPSPQPLAVRVNCAQLAEQLRDRAADLGVQCLYATAAARFDAGEQWVSAVLDGREPVQAKFLVFADGALSAAGSPTDTPVHWVATASAPAGRDDRDGHLHWVLGLDGGESLACWWVDDSQVVVRLYARGSAESVRADLLALVGRIADRGLLPAKRAPAGPGMVCRPAPAQSALEIESHVGKRSLRIGDAGGFFAQASRESIFPALWSARLAVDVLVRAARSQCPQDDLREFSSVWRTTMAEYLCPPNAETQFLLPLIFTNQQMADRMAAAFWRGQVG